MLTVTTGVEAQHAKLYRLAIVATSASLAAMNETGLFQVLRSCTGSAMSGGKNLVVERYSGEGRPEHYAQIARELVSRKPDLMFAIAVPMVTSLRAATATIPIVGLVADPVG